MLPPQPPNLGTQRMPPFVESGFAPMLAYCFVLFWPLQAGIGAMSGAATPGRAAFV